MSRTHAITAGEARFYAYLSQQGKSWKKARAIQESCSISEGSLHAYIRRFKELGLCEVAPMQPQRYRFSAPTSPEGVAYHDLLKVAAEVIEGEESEK